MHLIPLAVVVLWYLACWAERDDGRYREIFSDGHDHFE